MDALEKVAFEYDVPTRQIFKEICEAYHRTPGQEIMLWEAYRTELFLPTFVLISCQCLLIQLYEDRLVRHIDTPIFTWADAQRMIKEGKTVSGKELL